MNTEIQKLHRIWQSSRAVKTTFFPKNGFKELANTITSSGPFYYYIVDFYDMSLSHISPAIYDLHGSDPNTVTFDDILQLVHPDDLDFVSRAESKIADFFNNNIGADKLLHYKISYCFRALTKDSGYVLFNHQALMLTLDDTGKFGKSLNIHTRIDHLSKENTNKISLIGLYGEPSFIHLNVDIQERKDTKFSKREVDIIKLIAEGLSNKEIAEKLFIASVTVKKHRQNILLKAGCKNTAQLIKNSILQGLI
ncbi:LuxR C-terminal-related transcriptional regulator [Sphingobacterium spiritivorum]|uniref:LuxR C-terminal-related transcriptional regulator n=1 Tax=Sphingobacterium spiritivorum TaxID=258 RepID=UPI003DA1F03E